MKKLVMVLIPLFLSFHGNVTNAKPAIYFLPPAETAMPNDEFGKVVKSGEQIFNETQKFERRKTRKFGPTLGCLCLISGLPKKNKTGRHFTEPNSRLL